MSDSGTGALVNRLANPPNPFEQFGQTVNALTAARQYRAQEAVGEIYNRNIDPTTGTLNMGAFNADVARDPDARMFAGPTMQKAGEAVGAQGIGRAQDVAGIMAGVEARQASLSPLYAQAQLAVQGKGPPVTGAQVMEAAKNMPKLSPDMQANLDRQLAEIGPNGDASNLVIGGYYANQHTREMLQAQTPGYGAFSTGGFVTPTQVNPRAPGGVSYPTPGVPIQLGMSPAEQNQPVNLIIGNQPVQVRLGDMAPLLASNPLLMQALTPEQRAIVLRAQAAAPPPGGVAVSPAPPQAAPAPTAPGGGATAPAPTTRTGGPPAPPQAAPAPATPTPPPYLQPPPPQTQRAPTGQLPPSGGLGVPPSPGEVKTQEQQAALGSGQLAALTTAVTQAPQTKALLTDMRSELNVPGWTPGMGADQASTWRQAMQRLHVATGATDTLNVNDAQGAQEAFKKDSSLLAGRMLDQLGGNPTDARQQLSELSTPGAALSREGNQLLISALLGGQHALEAQSRAWEQAKQQGWGDSQYAQWAKNNWNGVDKATGGRFDPRIFWMADGAGLEAQQKMVAKIQKDHPAAAAQFQKNFTYAKNQGWITQNPDRSWSVAVP
jgi:hypothetical protein